MLILRLDLNVRRSFRESELKGRNRNVANVFLLLTSFFVCAETRAKKASFARCVKMTLVAFPSLSGISFDARPSRVDKCA